MQKKKAFQVGRTFGKAVQPLILKEVQTLEQTNWNAELCYLNI